MSEIDNFPHKRLETPTISEVLATDQFVKAQISTMWANDSEFWDIDAIVQKARNWTLDCTTAILQIQWVMNSKQSYH